MPFSTVVSSAHASGQSCGQAPRTCVTPSAAERMSSGWGIALPIHAFSRISRRRRAAPGARLAVSESRNTSAMNILDSVVTQAASIAAIRRDIHAHPELCFQEVRTAEVVAKQLEAWGIP